MGAALKKPTGVLTTEIETYNKNLASLLQHEGKYVLIIGTHIVGTFDSYADALSRGYEDAKLTPFLVKKISGAEPVANFSRDVDNNAAYLITPSS